MKSKTPACSFGGLVFEDGAVVHDEADVFKLTDIFQRVAGDGDYIGVGARGRGSPISPFMSSISEAREVAA